MMAGEPSHDGASTQDEWVRWFYEQGAYAVIAVRPSNAPENPKRPYESWHRWQTERMAEDDLKVTLAEKRPWEPAVVPGGSSLACWDCDCIHAYKLLEMIGLPRATLSERRAETPDRMHVWFRAPEIPEKLKSECAMCENVKALDLRHGKNYTIIPGGTRYLLPGSPRHLIDVSSADLEMIGRLFHACTRLAKRAHEWGWDRSGNHHGPSLGLAAVLALNGIEQAAAEKILTCTFGFLGPDDDCAKNVQTTYARRDSGGVVSREGVTREQSKIVCAILRQSGFTLHSSESEPPIDRAPLAAGPSPPGHYARTDMGNAEYFSDHFSPNLKFDHKRLEWVIWRGHWWSPDEVDTATALAKLAALKRLEDTGSVEDEAEQKAELRWCKSSQSRGRLESMLKLAHSDLRVGVSGTNWNRDNYLLGVANGVVDLRTGTFREGRREDEITMHATASFDPSAVAPRWGKFIEEVFKGDAELARFIQKALGYSICGDTSEQIWFLCWGHGANGKSTLLYAMHQTLGDYYHNVPFQTFESNSKDNIPSDVADLAGRRFITAIESTDSARLNEARVKALTGEDPMKARHLYGKWFEFIPVGKLWLAANHKPVVFDDSFAFWRRVVLIPFLAQFEVNNTVKPALVSEVSGILNWLIEGFKMWKAEGLKPPESVLEITRDYREQSDSLADFLTEKCEIGADLQIAASQLYIAYAGFAQERRMKYKETMSATTFGRKIVDRFPRRRMGAGFFYRGITIRQPTPANINDSVPSAGVTSLGSDEKGTLAEHESILQSIIKGENVLGRGAPDEIVKTRATERGIGDNRLAWLMQHLQEGGKVHESDRGENGEKFWKVT